MKRIRKLPLWLFAATSICALIGTAYAQQTALNYTSAALFLWTDKNVYQPGDPITLRFTGRGNNDPSLYTAVIYLQNNQTGDKVYFRQNGGPSGTPTDIFGQTPGSFFPVVFGDITKSVMIGAGGWLAPTFSAPSGLGLYTFAFEVRDSSGGRVVKSAYTKFGVVNSVDTLSGLISTDRTLVNTKAYNLSGVVTVSNGATLTIEPGTFIFGLPGSSPPSMLLIGVNGKIRAEGTRSRPITMTSSQPIGSRAPGDWGGLVMLGKAQVNVTGGTNNIEGMAPSLDTTYGGTDNTHNCGTLAYVRVEFGGSILSPNNEINNITWGGCGSQTVAHHLQSRYGLDDMFEWFGGVSDAKYLVGQFGRDDYLDGQLGWSGRVQHGVMVAGATPVHGNRGIEMDNSEFNDRAAPLGKPQFYNLTFIGSGDVETGGFDEADSSAIYLRRGAAGAYNNMVLFNWIVGGVAIRNNSGSTATTDSVTRQDLTVNGIMMWDNGKVSGRPNTLAGQAADFGSTSNAVARDLLGGIIGSGRNVVVEDPMMRRPLYRSDPDYLPRPGSPIYRSNWVQPPDDGFFDQWARWNGAFGDYDWTEEWTVWAQEIDLK